MSSPIVNGIEKELGNDADVLRINLHSELGKHIAKEFDVTSAGTNLLVDGNGKVVYRHKGQPQRPQIVEAVSKMLA